MMIRTLRNFMADSSGIALIYVTALLPVLFGFTALAVDAGYLRYMKSRAQTAADAAALAGVAALPSPTAAATTFAEDEFLSGTFTLTVQTGAWSRQQWGTTGFQAGFAPLDAVRAEVAFSSGTALQTFFANALGFSEANVIADAVAIGFGGAPESCLVALDPDDDKALFINGTVNADLLDCGVYVNSTHPTAAAKAAGAGLDINLTKTVCPDVDPAKCPTPTAYVYQPNPNSFIVAGHCDGCETIQNGNPVIDPWDSTTDQDSGAQIADPYADDDPISDILSNAAYGDGVDWIDGSVIAGPPYTYNNTNLKMSPGDTMYPGVYAALSANSVTADPTAATVKWMPGVYVICPDIAASGNPKGIDFGNLNHESVESSVGAGDEGVTFVLTCGAELSMAGNGTIDLKAPEDTGGTNAITDLFGGFLVWGDPNPGGLTHKITGGSSTILEGAIYTPGDAYELAGNVNDDGSGTGSDCFMLIANTIKFSGTTQMNMSSSGCSGTYTGTPFVTAELFLLVE